MLSKTQQDDLAFSYCQFLRTQDNAAYAQELTEYVQKLVARINRSNDFSMLVELIEDMTSYEMYYLQVQLDERTKKVTNLYPMLCNNGGNRVTYRPGLKTILDRLFDFNLVLQALTYAHKHTNNLNDSREFIALALRYCFTNKGE